MDKRTLFFVVTLGAALFFVNMFFDYQNVEKRKEWLEQEQLRNKVKEKELVRLNEENALSPSALPLADIYNVSGEPLTQAVAGPETFLTAVWSEKAPEQVYTRLKEPYKLKMESNGFLLYVKEGSQASLAIARLPDFGTFQLQLAAPHPGGEAAVSAGEFADGSFTSYAEELYKVQAALPNEGGKVPAAPGKAIVLMKSEGEWRPVALFAGAGKAPLLLEESSFPVELLKAKREPGAAGSSSENFYVLENGYQQLVFSNYGGALVEINLPFEDEAHPKSVVKEISVDREMVEKYPDNALFPSHSYFTPGASPAGPFVEHEKGTLGGYYPLLRRDLIEQGKKKSVRVAPEFYALNIVSQYPEVARLSYAVTHFDKEKIVFEANQGSRRRITKTYTLSSDGAPYCFDLKINIEGESSGLWITSGVPDVEIISGAPAPALKYRITRQGKGEVAQVDIPVAGEATASNSILPDWLSNGNGFFGLILNPQNGTSDGYRAQYVSGTEVPSRLVELGQEYERFEAKKLPGYLMALPLKQKGGTASMRIFAGPYSTPILKAVDSIYTDPATGANPDYIGCQTFHGWFAFISEPFAKFLFLLMNFFHWATGSWGLSIILLTIALRVMLYPLNSWSTRSMVKMQELSPKIQELQKKHKGDQKKLQIETMNLYREAGVNPFSGCLPMLIQLPFLLGMFDLLKSSFQLRGAVFIPGWIDNLSAPDVLFSWETPLPIIGNAFHLLPIITGAAMFFQMRLSSPLPEDKSLWTEQQRQQRAMSTFMPLLLVWVFYTAPSGLNIYWISSTALGALQQWRMTQKSKAKKAQPVVEIEGQPKSNKRAKIKGKRS